jgi:hypothetical protein
LSSHYTPRLIFNSITQAKEITPFFIDEVGLGIWLYTADPVLLAQGRVISIIRDAIHLPSVEQNGQPIASALQAEFIRRAQALGLSQLSQATGYWTLAATGELQTEAVIIAHSPTPVDQSNLLELTEFIRHEGRQEAVAWEQRGVVHHYLGK